MMSFRLSIYCLLSMLLVAGCAQQTTPTGGKKDTIPPRLISISPLDSQKNVRPERIDLKFDEYITVNDPGKEVTISPLLRVPLIVTSNGKNVTVKIPDSLLEDNTTYRISMGTAIRDVHEGNQFANYRYMFSTGAYFDSLSVAGRVMNAATGLPDSSGIAVVLYDVANNDSIVVKQTPKYIARTDAKGEFNIGGLPARQFRIYAIKDANGNLMYDGPSEMIAYSDQPVQAGDTTVKQVALRLFREEEPVVTAKADSATSARRTGQTPAKDKEALTYTTNIDTNIKKRTFDINNKIVLSFNKAVTINTDRITLKYDSGGTEAAVNTTINTDSATPNVVHIKADWLENATYTLRLAKGFAKDTGGIEANPGKYTYRTQEDADYGKITINIPANYTGKDYVLMVSTEADTVYKKPVQQLQILLTRLKPGKYRFMLIADKNSNGKWDTGVFFDKKQPEEVIPYKEVLQLKSGWENIVDFAPEKVPTEKNERSNSK